MKAKAARRKSTRKTKPARKATRIHLAGRVTSFFKKKNSFWNKRIACLWNGPSKATR